MKTVIYMKKYMLPIVFILIFISTFLSIYLRNYFLILKFTLPIALFMMLYKPMVYLDLTKLLTKRSSHKIKYVSLTTIFYVLIFPLLTYLLLNTWISMMPETDPRLLAGIVLIGLAPIASSAPAFTSIAGGKVQLTLVGVILTFILSLAVIPFYAKWILKTVIQVPLILLVKSLVIYIIIPLIIGQLTKYIIIRHYKTGDVLEKLKEPLEGVSLMGLYWMVVIVFGINGLLIIHRPLLIIIGAVIMNIYFLVRMGLIYLSGKIVSLPKERNISLLFSASSNMTIATAIAIGTFGSLAAVGTALGGPFSDMVLMIILSRLLSSS